MASVKLGKESKEWQFMSDYWKVIQEYFIPERTEEYWQKLTEAFDALAEKYENDNFPVCLMLGYLRYLEEKAKNE